MVATVAYPKLLKRAWGYDPSDVLTGYPPSQRAAIQAAGGVGAADGLNPAGVYDGGSGCLGLMTGQRRAAPAAAAARDAGSSGSRKGLLTSWLLNDGGGLASEEEGERSGAAAAAAAEAGGGSSDPVAVVVSPVDPRGAHARRLSNQ